MHEKGVVEGVADRDTALDYGDIDAEELLMRIIEVIKKLEKECCGTNEETFNKIVANKIKEKCLDGDMINKVFLTKSLQLVHDEIY